MLKRILILRDEIEDELANIDNLKDNLEHIKYKNLNEELKTRVSASLLDDFYLAIALQRKTQFKKNLEN